MFRSLFRGREDVYACRWENPDGRSGYSPAAQKDWTAINRSTPEDRKKVDQKTRKYFPLTDSVIENHLLGKQTIGVYPLLSDETCWFLAVDFDKKTWQEDSIAFMDTCRKMAVPAALERSRSGRGGHVWIFFEDAVPAITARKLGCAILTCTMERRHQLGLDSYDAQQKLVAATEDQTKFLLFDLNTKKWSDLVASPDSFPVWEPSLDGKYLYCTTAGADPKAVRIRIADHSMEVITSLKNLRLVDDFYEQMQIGVAPDGSPLFTRDVGTQEVYALQMKWP